MNKKTRTVMGIAGVCLLSMLIIWTVYLPAIRAGEEGIRRQERIFRDYQSLLRRKVNVQSEWQSLKSSREDLNTFLKALLAYAQGSRLAMDKLEPAGDNSVFVSFQGDVIKLADFIYELTEKHPAVKIRSFSMRRDENAKSFSYEFMLGELAS